MKIQRLIAILSILLQKEVVSASWFAEKFEVSVRTIYRDIQALETAGIPIVTYPGINGGFGIIDEYKIDKKLFTSEDLWALLMGLKSVSDSVANPQVNLTLEKIRTLIPNEHEKSIDLKSRQLYVDMTPWAKNPVLTRCLDDLKHALNENKVIAFDYSGRHGERVSRRAEPHQLILKENNWYLRAFCRIREDFRIFRVNRIKNLLVTNEHFETRAFDDGLTDFKDWQSERMIIVELVMDASLRERALDYCREENMEELENGRIFVRLPFVESDMGYGVLLSLGHQCEVLSPQPVRAELRRRIALLSGLYDKDRE